MATPLPQDTAPGETVDRRRAGQGAGHQPDRATKRADYALELGAAQQDHWAVAVGHGGRSRRCGRQAAVEEPTSDQLGLEKFYSYAGKNTGAGSTVMDNLYAGNAVWSYNAFTNPSRGLATFVRLAYNSLDTSDTVAGYGWSLQASVADAAGPPLDFHPNPNPTDGHAHRRRRHQPPCSPGTPMPASGSAERGTPVS